MQRPVSLNRDIDLENQQPEMNATPRRRSIDGTRAEILATFTRSVNGRRSVPRWYTKQDSFSHLIPLLIFICFFLLWWFSFPVAVVSTEDSEMTHKTILMEMPHDLKNSRISLAILAKAAPPEPLLPGISTEINATNGHPVSGDYH